MKRFVSAAAALTTMVLASACGTTPDGGSTAADASLTDCKGQSIKQTQTAVTLLYLPANMAIEANYFDELGLKVEIVELGASTESLQAVAAGSADIAVVSLSQTLAARTAGAPVRAISMVTTPMAVQIVIKKSIANELNLSETSSPEERARAFKGRTIGISSPGASTDRVARFLMDSVGLNPDKDAKIVPLGGSSEAVAAFVRGSVDILVYSSPVTEKAALEGEGVSLVNVAAGDIPALDNFDSAVAVANANEVKKNPSKYVCYAMGLQKAMSDIKDDYQVAADAVYPSFKGVDKSLYDLGLKNTAPAYVGSIEISDDQVAKAVGFVKQFGGKVSEEAEAEVVATDVIDRAIEALKNGEK